MEMFVSQNGPVLVRADPLLKRAMDKFFKDKNPRGDGAWNMYHSDETRFYPQHRHFRLPGHDPHRDLVMIPIEIVSARDPFLLRARESYNIWKFRTEKGMGVLDIEHGLNLDPGQQ